MDGHTCALSIGQDTIDYLQGWETTTTGQGRAEPIHRGSNARACIPPVCPKCGSPLTYLFSEAEWDFYRCPTHRTVVLPMTERVKVNEPEDSDVTH
jgi:hypothetical protein